MMHNIGADRTQHRAFDQAQTTRSHDNQVNLVLLSQLNYSRSWLSLYSLNDHCELGLEINGKKLLMTCKAVASL